MPPAAGRGPLRVSHADREHVIDARTAALVRGVLAKDEFDPRVGQTLASRTCAELAAVTADLPARLAAAQPPQPARAPAIAGSRSPRRWRRFAVTAPVAPSRQGRLRRAGDCGPGRADSTRAGDLRASLRRTATSTGREPWMARGGQPR